MTEYIASIVKKILQTKILVLEELDKIDQCMYQMVLFVVRKSEVSLKIKIKTLLSIIQHILYFKLLV